MKIREKDRANIFALYESMKYDDYLMINECDLDSYDWNKFFSHPCFGIQGDFLLEDFKKIEDDVSVYNGTQDTYRITLRNGMIFDLILNFWTPDETNDSITKREYAMSDAPYAKNRPEIQVEYSKIKEDLQVGDYMVLIQFKDSQGRHNQTGEVGVSSIELFIALKDAMLDSFKGRNMSKCRGILMRVSNSEIRRLGLYKKLIQKYLSHEFPNMFTDDETESGVGYTLLYATR